MATVVFHVTVLCAVIAVSLAGLLTPNFIAAPSCKEMNAATDKIVSNVNSANKDGVQDFVVSDQIIKPKFFGFGVYLKSAEPNFLKSTVTQYNSLSRSGDASNCSSSIFSTLDGQFTIGPVVWSFPNTTAEFLYLEAGGSLVLIADLEVEIVVAQGTMDCRLEAFKLQGIKNLSYEFVTESWIGWIVGKVLTHAISSIDANHLIQEASANITKSIVAAFSNQWCQAVRSV